MLDRLRTILCGVAERTKEAARSVVDSLVLPGHAMEELRRQQEREQFAREMDEAMEAVRRLAEALQGICIPVEEAFGEIAEQCDPLPLWNERDGWQEAATLAGEKAAARVRAYSMRMLNHIARWTINRRKRMKRRTVG